MDRSEHLYKMGFLIWAAQKKKIRFFQLKNYERGCLLFITNVFSFSFLKDEIVYDFKSPSFCYHTFSVRRPLKARPGPNFIGSGLVFCISDINGTPPDTKSM